METLDAKLYTFVLPAELRQQLERIAKAQDLSTAAATRHAIRDYIRKHKRDTKRQNTTA